MTLPNKEIIQSSQQGILPLSTGTKANTALLLPNLTNSSLLSIGQMCDDDCVAVFIKHAMHIYKNAKIILLGQRNNIDGLWDIAIQNPSDKSLHAHAIIQRNLPKTHLAQYLHACAYSPALPTFKKAINNGQFIT